MSNNPPIRLRRVTTAPEVKPAWPPYLGLASVAKPKPKPKPKPVPPAQPVAAAAKTKPELPSCGAQLPVVPLLSTDVPQGATVVLGTLNRGENPQTFRPVVVLCVPCACKESEHAYPWRSDWAVDVRVRSHQRSRCRKHKGPHGVWLAIDPRRVGRSRQAVQGMREALTTWKVTQTAEKAKKRAPAPEKETANV